MTKPCDNYTDPLVDYADGDLSQDEAQRVAQHLATCESCRRTVQALERSLGLMEGIWSENLGESDAAVAEVRPRRLQRVRLYALAASILIVASVVAVAVFHSRQQQASAPFEEVQQEIARVGAAAELLAATQIIARCEGTEAIVERQYRYILEEYAGTPAANSIRAQYGSRLGDL